MMTSENLKRTKQKSEKGEAVSCVCLCKGKLYFKTTWSNQGVLNHNLVGEITVTCTFERLPVGRLAQYLLSFLQVENYKGKLEDAHDVLYSDTLVSGRKTLRVNLIGENQLNC